MIAACSLVGGIASALLIGPTEFLSLLIGPPVAGLAAAFFTLWERPRARTVATAGGWTLLGSIAVMLGIVFIEAIIYAFFG